eukprot:6204236-Pleurochrysis_carterae.AAC.1
MPTSICPCTRGHRRASASKDSRRDAHVAKAAERRKRTQHGVGLGEGTVGPRRAEEDRTVRGAEGRWRPCAPFSAVRRWRCEGRKKLKRRRERNGACEREGFVEGTWAELAGSKEEQTTFKRKIAAERGLGR